MSILEEVKALVGGKVKVDKAASQHGRAGTEVEVTFPTYVVNVFVANNNGLSSSDIAELVKRKITSENRRRA